MKKRALVIGPGGLKGAYDVGVLVALLRKFGSNYFDAIYASSVGVYAASFFVANQSDTMEEIWKNHVNGSKLFSIFNPLKGKPMMDVGYLERLFSFGKLKLDANNIKHSKTKLFFVLTKYPNAELIYKQVNDEDVLKYQKAACALPFLYPPVKINKETYSDVGAMIEPLPIRKAMEDGYTEIVVVYNKQLGLCFSKWFIFLVKYFAPLLLPKKFVDLMKKQHLARENLEDYLKNHSDILKIIRPKKSLPVKNMIDTNKERICKTFDIGFQDGMVFDL